MRRNSRILFTCLLVLPVAAEDCPNCAQDEACEPHANADKSASVALTAARRDGNAATRFEAVQAYAKACASHPNCRPKTNAAALVPFLDDLDFKVAAAAATALGETQDPVSAANYLSRQATLHSRTLERGKAVDARTREDHLQRLDAMAEGIALTGEAGGMPLALLLQSKDVDVMSCAAVRCRRTRGRLMPSTLLDAIERCRMMPASEKRDMVCQEMVVSFEELTQSGIKSPIGEARDPNEMDRWIENARKWVAKYGRTWK